MWTKGDMALVSDYVFRLTSRDIASATEDFSRGDRLTCFGQTWSQEGGHHTIPCLVLSVYRLSLLSGLILLWLSTSDGLRVTGNGGRRGVIPSKVKASCIHLLRLP